MPRVLPSKLLANKEAGLHNHIIFPFVTVVGDTLEFRASYVFLCYFFAFPTPFV